MKPSRRVCVDDALDSERVWS